MAQDRDTFRQLAELRLAEAEHLLANGHPSGAYYLAGYAIECALKAKIASGFRANEIPDRKLVNQVYTHDLSELFSSAGLREAHTERLAGGGKAIVDWTIVKEWSEAARYRVWTKDQASDMLEAIGGSNGMLAWVLKHL